MAEAIQIQARVAPTEKDPVASAGEFRPQLACSWEVYSMVGCLMPAMAWANSQRAWVLRKLPEQSSSVLSQPAVLLPGALPLRCRDWEALLLKEQLAQLRMALAQAALARCRVRLLWQKSAACHRWRKPWLPPR